MCPPGYNINGFVATHALGHMTDNVATAHQGMICHMAIVVAGRAYCFHDNRYITLILLL